MEINTTKKSKEGKQRQCKVFCVAGGPNNKLCANNGDTPGVNMHRFPTEPSIRQQWVRFVKMHRVDFNPSNYSSRIYLCFAVLAEEQCRSVPRDWNSLVGHPTIPCIQTLNLNSFLIPRKLNPLPIPIADITWKHIAGLNWTNRDFFLGYN